jgi:MFS family permease
VGLGLICGIISAPIFGRIYDKTKNIRRLLLVCGLVMSIGVAGIAITTTAPLGLYIAGISNVLVGIFSTAVFTIAYASAKETNRKRTTEISNEDDTKSTITKNSYDTLAIGWVNCLSLFGAFWVPIFFSFVVQHVGYATAWLLGGISSLLFVLPSLGIMTAKVKSCYRD